MSNLKSKILSVCAWIFGVFSIVLGISALDEGAWLAALLFLIGGCLLLPPVKRLILDKKSNLSRNGLTVAGVVLVFTASFAMPSYEQGASSIETNPSTQALSNEEPVDADISNDVEQVSSAEIDNNSVVSSFDASQYPHIPLEDAQMYFLFASLKLASTQLSDEEYLYLRNIEGIRSENAFEYKEALDNIEMYRDEFRKKDIPTKVAVDFITGDLRDVDIKPRSNFTISEYGHYLDPDPYPAEYEHYELSGDFTLNSYDFNKKGFSLAGDGASNYYGHGCSLQYSSSFPQESIPKLFYSEDNSIYFFLSGMKMSDDEWKNKCFIPVSDEAVAAKIEAAKVDEKIIFTGTSYYTLENSFPGIRGNLDAIQINVHIIQPDRSLSKPLASIFLMNDASNTAPNMYDLTADMSISNRF